jgi:hypothetical protein
MPGYDNDDDDDFYDDLHDEEAAERAEREHRRAFRQLMDARELMDPAAQRVLDASLAMDAITRLREARDRYLADIGALREGGHPAEPDAGLLASLGNGIERWLRIAEGNYDPYPGGTG